MGFTRFHVEIQVSDAKTELKTGVSNDDGIGFLVNPTSDATISCAHLVIRSIGT